MALKIVVLAKQVPDTRNVGPDAMTPEGTVNRAALPAVFNPEDLNALEQALRLNPDYAPVLNNYAYFLALKARKLHKALRMSAKTVKLEPDNPTYLDTYGWVLYLLGKAEEAKPVFKHALVYGGNQSDEVLAHYASVLESLGEKDRAEYYRAQIRNRK